jgi:predicted NACHT family NTPase
MQYSWTRFCYPQGGQIQLDSKGYLLDPSPTIGSLLNPQLITLEKINDAQCLILLGEPGIGKTTELNRFINHCKQNASRSKEAIIVGNLRDYPTEYALEQFIFRDSDFESWIRGDYRLTLFLDSLDEGLLTIGHLANFLGMRLEKLPVERLQLCIACRALEWPPSLGERLMSLWGKEKTRFLELAPLRRIDVHDAANSEGIDPDQFLLEVEKKEVVPFATRPVTLRFLIDTYHDQGNLPGNKIDLYEIGCLHLCTETNQSQVETRMANGLLVSQRLRVAGRIAAQLLFSNRAAIWTGIEGVPENTDLSTDIALHDLVGKSEEVNGYSFQVGESQIRETLSTALFSLHGPNRMSFSHQTYAEYLAAWYLNALQAPLVQIQSLILHPLDPEGKLIPQLSETSAWLANFRDDVAKLITNHEPSVLLRGDITALKYKQRKILIDALLQRYENGTRIEQEWGLHQKLTKLSHPDIANQLKPYITDRNKDPMTRNFAIDLAKACSVVDLQNSLADIALDFSENFQLRINSGWAVVRIGNDETKIRLLPFVYSQFIEDPEDEFRGIGLMANWPRHLSSRDLFFALTPPKDEAYYGSYAGFISSLIHNIGQIDIHEALKWAVNQHYAHDSVNILNELIDSIVIEAWNHLDDPEVLDGLARLVIIKLNEYKEIVRRDPYFSGGSSSNFYSRMANEDQNRRSLIRALISLFYDEKQISLLAYSRSRIIENKDFIWLLSLFTPDISQAEKIKLASLAQYIFDQKDIEHIEAVFNAMQKEDILKETFLPYFGPILFVSTLADNMRHFYQQTKELGAKKDIPLTLNPPIKDQIETLLNQFEIGDLNAWWKLNLRLLSNPDGRFAKSESEFDITQMPGWVEANDETKARIIRAAMNYILESGPDLREWLGKTIIYRPVFAAFRALYLLYKVSRADIDNLPVLVWKKWVPILIAYPIRDARNDEDEELRGLIILAYKNVPDEVLLFLQQLVHPESPSIDSSVLARIEPILDEQIIETLLNILKSDKIHGDAFRILLEKLLVWGNEGSIVIAKDIIKNSDFSNNDSIQKALIGVRSLMFHTTDACWVTIWPLIQDHEKFGEDLIGSIAFEGRGREEGIYSRLSPVQLADFYIWLVGRFPPSEDPGEKGFHSVSIREEIGNFRDLIPHYLAQMGTHESFMALEKIVQFFPDNQGLKFVKQESDTNVRRNSWVPLSPKELLLLIKEPKNRQIQNGEQLIDLIIESLCRLEQELHGETPSVVFLWNEWTSKNETGETKKHFRPKEENRLSDFIKLHFVRDIQNNGIVINREVEIRPTIGNKPGEETDIRVDVIKSLSSSEEKDIVSVIIETKGCWNNDLDTDMKNQLVNRYLLDNRCQNGLYLVGWYNCSQWDDADYKKTRCKYRTIEELRHAMYVQTQELSKCGHVIKTFTLDVSLR